MCAVHCGEEQRRHHLKGISCGVCFMFGKKKPHSPCSGLGSDLLDELSHVLTQCFTARPLALAVAVERVGAGVLLVTVGERHSEMMSNCLIYFITTTR